MAMPRIVILGAGLMSADLIVAWTREALAQADPRAK